MSDTTFFILLGIGLVCVAVIVWKEDVDFNEHEIKWTFFLTLNPTNVGLFVVYKFTYLGKHHIAIQTLFR